MSDFTVNIEKHLSRLGRDIQDLVEKVIPVYESKGDFSPPCDIVESDKEYRIYLDLPGLDKKDIRVVLKDHVLSISGERKIDPEEGGALKRNERKSGAFSRSFSIPEEVEASETNARFRKGVLEITIPRTESEDETQSIPVE